MSSNNNDYFILYANCIPVKGANRSVICDLHLNRLKLIPNDLFTILTTHNNKTLLEIKNAYNNEFDNIIDEYYDFLLNSDLGFFTNTTPNHFPRLNLKWFSASEITNSIIDIDEHSNFNVLSVLSQLNDLGCKHVQIRYFKSPRTSELLDISEHLESIKSSIVSIEFILKFNSEVDLEDYEKLLQIPRLFSITIHSSSYNKHMDFPESKKLIFITDNINSHMHCGNINSDYFSVNIKNFTESLKYNSCLNKKLSIDSNGQIKNCPSMSESFGYVEEITLEDALSHRDFSKHWAINKDKIIICKDCEFRYVCTDCRAFIEDPKDDASKPLKCGYNPYANVWEDWSTNPFKLNAIEQYNMKELVK